MNAAVEMTGTRAYRATLGSLLEGIAVPARDVTVTGLALDSRQVERGGAFLACQGHAVHGLDHAAAAVERGAAAVLWEPAPGVTPPALPAHVVVQRVAGLRSVAGRLADRFFERPSQDLRVAGFTGTNGKTTSAYLLAQAADLVGRRGAYLGTLGFGRAGALRDAGLTTPDVVSVHRRLAEARDDGAKVLGLEVSSHALAQGRVDAVLFDTAVFTNLTRDHLDYHGTLDAYGAAKERLLRAPGLGRAVINVRDAFGRRLASRLDGDVDSVLFTTSNEMWIEPGARWIRLPELRATTAGLTLHVD